MTDKKNAEKLGFTGLDDLLEKKVDVKRLTTFEVLSDNSNNEEISNKSVADQSSTFMKESVILANKNNWRKITLICGVVTILVSSILFYLNSKKSEETGPWNNYQSDTVVSDNDQLAPAPDTAYEEINDAGPAVELISPSPNEPYIKDPYEAKNKIQLSWKNSDPNGNSWPANTGYLDSFRKEHTRGLSNLTVDNTGNDSDVYVKLCSISSSNCNAVRHVLIKAGDKFTMHKISTGSYDVRYRDLTVGSISKSEPFVLEEISINNGTQFSEMTMTLYKVHNGNMHTTSISESEF